MTKLNPLIPELRISSEFQPLVDAFISEMSREIPSLHSIYICGSVPRGTAVTRESDADFTVVLENDYGAEEKERISSLVRQLRERHQEVSKIDVPICTEKDVLEQPYDMGFWIKIVSACIYGEDLSGKVPDLYPGYELQKTYYEAARSQVPKSIDAAVKAKDSIEGERGGKKALKKIIRAIYSLYIEEEDEWQEDFPAFVRVIRKFAGSENPVINRLLEAYASPSAPDFESIAKGSFEYYLSAFDKLSQRRSDIGDGSTGRAYILDWTMEDFSELKETLHSAGFVLLPEEGSRNMFAEVGYGDIEIFAGILQKQLNRPFNYVDIQYPESRTTVLISRNKLLHITDNCGNEAAKTWAIQAGLPIGQADWGTSF